MKFEAYTRLFMESFLIFCIASVSEIHRDNTSTSVKKRSFIFSIFILILVCIFIIIAVLNALKLRWKDQFNSSVKEGYLPRFYSSILILRLAIFGILLLLVDDEYSKPKVYVVAILQLLHLVYLIVIRPFKAIQDNLIEIINDVIYLFLVLVLSYYCTKSRWSTDFTDAYRYIILINIFSATVISVVTLCVNLIKKCRNRKKKKQVEQKPQINQNVTEDFNMKSDLQLVPKGNLNPETHFEEFKKPTRRHKTNQYKRYRNVASTKQIYHR